MTDDPIIEATGLVKRYGRLRALDGLDLVAPGGGRCLAVLGPNGAGKTTFVRTVATLLRPDAGTLRVAGIDVVRHPDRVRRLIGLAGQYAAVEEAMTGRENVEMVGRLLGYDRRTARRNADIVLAHMRLTGAADRLVRTYSGGMKRRLDLGVSLVGAPRLLLLDEPTAGLDPRSRIELWGAIAELVELGTDVLLTTQYLDEADHLAAQIVIIDHGRVIARGTPAELKARAGRDVIEVHVPDRDQLHRLVAALEPVGTGPPRLDAATQRVTVPVGEGTAVLPAALRAIEERGVAIDDIALRRPTLNEVFLSLTGNGREDASSSDDRGGRESPRGAGHGNDATANGRRCHDHGSTDDGRHGARTDAGHDQGSPRAGREGPPGSDSAGSAKDDGDATVRAGSDAMTDAGANGGTADHPQTTTGAR